MEEGGPAVAMRPYKGPGFVIPFSFTFIVATASNDLLLFVTKRCIPIWFHIPMLLHPQSGSWLDLGRS
jgi:hypothetical protein